MASIKDPPLSVASSGLQNWVLPNSIEVRVEYNAKSLQSIKSLLKLEVDDSWPEGFHDLPRNVLVKIFQHFSEKDLSSRLGPVCRNWHLASKNPTLWKRLEFSGATVPTPVICRMLRLSPQLESLSLVEVPNVATVIRQLCRCNLKVKHVAVRYCSRKENPLPETVFRNLLASCPKLSSLNLRGTQIRVYRLFHDLIFLKNLRCLDLGANWSLSLHNLMAIALNCRGLEELLVSPRYVNLTDNDASFIIGSLKTRLVTLKFDVSKLNGVTFQSILGCTQLCELSLTCASLLTGDLMRSLAIHLPNLTKLKLSNASQLTSEDFCYLFSVHRDVMSRITKLDLTNCWGLGDAGLKSIVDTSANSLQHLSLKCCKNLSSNALDYIVERCSRLHHLNMAHVSVEISTLIKIPSRLLELKVLIIDNNINERNYVLHKLKTSMKQLKIMESLSEYSQKHSLLLCQE